LDAGIVNQIIREAAGLAQVADRCWIDYDREADVLYISLERPQDETESELTDDDVLLSFRDDQLVGITVLNASTRLPALSAK
jgi:uncharacterized protein YuzE